MAELQRSLRAGSGQLLFGYFAGVAQHERAPLIVVEIDISPRVDRDFLAPIDRRRMGACVLRQARPLRRYEIAYLSRQLRIADVENSQARIKIRNVDQIARLLHRGIMDFLIGIVWSKASALLAKI